MRRLESCDQDTSMTSWVDGLGRTLIRRRRSPSLLGAAEVAAVEPFVAVPPAVAPVAPPRRGGLIAAVANDLAPNPSILGRSLRGIQNGNVRPWQGVDHDHAAIAGGGQVPSVGRELDGVEGAVDGPAQSLDVPDDVLVGGGAGGG